jgi:RNA polymerase sigma-70 factor (sigma-E family)
VFVTFEEFVAARLGALIRYATVVTWDPHLAEDITQDVLVRAQARWSRIGRLDAPEQYVKRMVLNEFLSWRRRRAAHLVFVPTLEGMTPHEPDRTGAVDDLDLARRLIADLPPKQRAAIALRYYEDLTDEQIAELLGCRTGTVRSYLSRGLATLRKALPASRDQEHEECV